MKSNSQENVINPAKTDIDYPTVLVIVQKARETNLQISHDIVQLIIVQYRTYAYSVTLFVFFQVA